MITATEHHLICAHHRVFQSRAETPNHFRSALLRSPIPCDLLKFVAQVQRWCSRG